MQLKFLGIRLRVCQVRSCCGRHLCNLIVSTCLQSPEVAGFEPPCALHLTCSHSDRSPQRGPWCSVQPLSSSAATAEMVFRIF